MSPVLVSGVILYRAMEIPQLGCQLKYLGLWEHLVLTQYDTKSHPWNPAILATNPQQECGDLVVQTQCDPADFLTSLHINLCHKEQSAGSRGYGANTGAKLSFRAFPCRHCQQVYSGVLLLDCELLSLLTLEIFPALERAAEKDPYSKYLLPTWML